MAEEWAWERKAMRGAPMPEGLSLEDQAAYQAISALHVRFSKGGITKEQASKEKQVIRNTYKQRIEAGKFWNDLCSRTSRLWKNIECKVYLYNDNPCVETADDLIDTIYGVPMLKRHHTPGKEVQEKEAQEEKGEEMV